MAEHGFTFTFTGNETENKKHGLGGLKGGAPTANSPVPPDSIWGWNVGDEPGLAQFPAFAKKFDAIRRYAPSKIGFANMLETYCPPLSLSANPTPPNSTVNWTLTYEDYVERFVTEVRPSFLCMDYYRTCVSFVATS